MGLHRYLRYILLSSAMIILAFCVLLLFSSSRKKIDYNDSMFIQAACHAYNNIASEEFYIRYRESDKQFSIMYYQNSDQDFQPFIPSDDVQIIFASGATGIKCFKAFDDLHYVLFIYDTLSLSVEEGCIITSNPLRNDPKYQFLWQNEDCFAYSF